MISSVKPVRWVVSYACSLAAVLCGSSLSVATAKAAVVTLDCVSDNWISSCSSGCTANNGHMAELRVRTSWWGTSGSEEPKNFRSLLSFDLSSLPQDANLITSATLGLYYFATAHGDPAGRTYDVHGVSGSWTEMGSTWQARDDFDQPSPVYWDSHLAGAPAYQPGGGDFDQAAKASVVVPAEFGWMTWDVTDLLAERVGGLESFGLILEDSDEIESNPGGKVSYMAFFHSAEFAEDPGLRPYLEVTYVPEPGTLALAGMGLLALGGLRSKPRS
ncbi:MAG: DNRLRE domain-containing protein [Phycisphaerae bacterium]|nr:DNRLRE domain-containing protein [Phycisphaerae bacterium]